MERARKQSATLSSAGSQESRRHAQDILESWLNSIPLVRREPTSNHELEQRTHRSHILARSGTIPSIGESRLGPRPAKKNNSHSQLAPP